MGKLAKQMSRINRIQNRVEALMYLQRQGLNAAHAYLSLENKAAGLPYHNTDHCLTVTKWCGRLVGLSDTSDMVSEKGLLLAAIFHDIDHGGGTCPDSDNIKRAVDHVERFARYNNGLIDDTTLAFATSCIRVTEYPFIVEPTTFEERIIRDADILQSIDVDFENILGNNLRLEIAAGRESHVSRVQFAEGELAFIDTIKMYTGPGAVLWSSCKPVLIQRFQEIAKGNRK